MTVLQERVVAEAEKWLGTPYRHQASQMGVGCDCLGLVRGVWAALYGHAPEVDAPYAADWAERARDERLLQAAMHYCGPAIPLSEMAAGDILLFRWRPHFAAKHIGILSDTAHFIHAYEQAGVIRSALVDGWRRRIAGVYRGLAYVVFERLPLDMFGNRIPVMQFEVLRPTGALESQVRAVAIIPGATEHGL